jgi:putative ABC transport system permease protein
MTVALGIGANAAVFSVVDAVLLRPLPYPHPDRLVALRSNQSVPEVEDIRAAATSLDQVGGITLFGLDLTTDGEPHRVTAGLVDAGLFDVLGAVPASGRLINRDEDVIGGPPLVVLSHGFWQQRLGGAPGVVGSTLTLSGRAYTVVGVLPAGFTAPGQAPDLWASVRVVYPAGAIRGVHFLRTYGRLRDGATLGELASEMTALDARLAADYPAESRNRRTVVLPLLERMVSRVQPTLLTLFAAVNLVLLVAAANLANLLLSRALRRLPETRVRAALGAGRWALMRPLLAEGLLVSIAGAVAGLTLARWSVHALVAMAPASLPRAETVSVDGRVLAYGLAVAMVTSLVFAALPAWTTTRVDLAGALRARSRGTVSGRGRLPSVLIAAEVALSVVLLVGAGLLIRTLHQLGRADLGFRPEGVLTARVELPESRYQKLATQTAYRDQVLAGFAAAPGIEAALISEPPLSGQWLTHDLAIEGVSVAEGDEPETLTRSVAGDYLGVMGIPLVQGRWFTRDDRAGGEPVAVVNQAFVRAYLSGQHAAGRRIAWARRQPMQWMTTVGVVGDVRHFGPASGDGPAVYTPYAQAGVPWKRWQYVVARGGSSPAELARTVRHVLWSIDHSIPLTDVLTADQLAGSAVAGQRFQAALLGVFGALAVLLAAAGIFGVTAQAVTARTAEVGVRMALGARPSSAAVLLIRRALTVCAVGAGIGLAASLAAGRLLSSALYGVAAWDPLTLGIAAVVVVAIATAASAVPAWRAARIDPAAALRE